MAASRGEDTTTNFLREKNVRTQNFFCIIFFRLLILFAFLGVYHCFFLWLGSLDLLHGLKGGNLSGGAGPLFLCVSVLWMGRVAPWDGPSFWYDGLSY